MLVNKLTAVKQLSTRILNLSLASIIGLSSLVAATPLLFPASAAAAVSGNTLSVVNNPTSLALYNTVVKAADHLLAQQNTDGGWSWYGTPGASSGVNLWGVTGLGLVNAYQLTHKAAYLTGATLTADHLVGIPTPTDLTTDNANHFYSSDIEFLAKMAVVTGSTAYSNKATAVMNHFLSQPNRYCASGCGTAQGIADYYHTADSAYPGYTEWSISDWVIAASLTGQTSWGTDLANIVKADVLAPTYDSALNTVANNYYALGLGAALNATSLYPSIDSTAISTKLVADQNVSTGAMNIYPSDGIDQGTAYSVLGLSAASDSSHATISANYLQAHQNANGGWTETDGSEYTEINSEIIQAIFSTLPTNTYYTIQDAITAANSGDTIKVATGTYNESPNITKSVTLQSTSGRDVTTIALQTSPTYLGSLTIGASNVKIDGFTIKGLNASGSNPVNASTNVLLSAGVSNVTLSNNKIEVGQVDTSPTGEDGIGILTTYTTSNVGDNFNVTGNIFQPLNGYHGFRVYSINPGIDHFTFSGNTITGNFTGTALAQAKNSLIQNNTITGVGGAGSRSAGFSTWGYPDPTVWGHATFTGNTISGTRRAISVYETNNVTISGNNLSGNGIGVWVGDATPLTFDTSTISISNNNLGNEDTFGVDNTMATNINAALNYWGSAHPVFGSIISGSVNYDPYFTNSLMTNRSDAITVPDSSGNGFINPTTPQLVVTSHTQPITVNVASGTTNATIDFSSMITGNTGMLPKTTVNTAGGNISIPASTTVTATGGNWDGVINAPTIEAKSSVSVPTPQGSTTTVGTVIEVGSNSVSLTFDKAVRLFIPGQAGELVGFVRNGVFTQISNQCSADTQTAGDALASGADCYANVGKDMVVWTKHFTTFVTYSQAVSAPIIAQTYTVAAGDTLTAIGAKVAVDWRLIASTNSITAPYTIYPGQVLQLPAGSDVPSTSTAVQTTTSVLGATSNPQIGTALKVTVGKSAIVASIVTKKANWFNWYWFATGTIVVLAAVGYYAYQASDKKTKKS